MRLFKMQQTSKKQQIITMQNFETKSKKYRKIGPYILLKVIGKGAYSTVYLAKIEGDPHKYAIKQISLMAVNPKQLERIHQEIQVLSLIKHRNIVCLLDSKQTSRNLYLVFEYCRHTDLEAYIQNYCLERLPEEKVKKITIQIKNAFQVLRANKVVHRDLKLANILVTEEFEIKIADFGFAKLLDDDQFFKSYVGTPLTMAPEILQNKSYNEKCDLWSLGIVIYQLLFGKNPFFTKNRMTKLQLKNAIKTELKIPDQISPEAADLLRRLIVRQPSQRISFEDFFKHPWLADQATQDDLNQVLLQEALRVELGTAILPLSKKKQEKDFLLNYGENLLAYEVIENVKSSVENKIMFWINLGKKIMSINYQNTKLSFLALALIQENLKKIQNVSIEVIINWKSKIIFPKFEQMRLLQKWEMSECTKRLPGFINRSVKKMEEYMASIFKTHQAYFENELDQSIVSLYLYQMINQVRTISRDHSISDQFSIFFKVRPFRMSSINLKLASIIFPDKVIDLLLKKMVLTIENNKMYKKCSGLFKLETLHQTHPEDRIYENLKLTFQ